MSEHTRGPWMVEEITLTISAPNPKAGRANLPVAYCPPDTLNRGANAALIAAAPELMAALKMILEASDSDPKGEEDAYKSAENAIAKAEGR